VTDPANIDSTQRKWPYVEAAVALALLIWRVIGGAKSALWRDWIVLLCSYWIFAALSPKSRLVIPLAVLLMSFMLGIYLEGQFRQMISLFR